MTLLGTVVEFDAERGFGAVSAENGEASLFFHCTAIADGTRTIQVGTEVAYRVVAGHQGRWEAMDVQPAAQGAAESSGARRPV